jgi:hypothetical protein
VVATVSETFTGFVPSSVTDDGVKEQVEFKGAPEQVSETVLLNPPSGESCN